MSFTELARFFGRVQWGIAKTCTFAARRNEIEDVKVKCVLVYCSISSGEESSLPADINGGITPDGEMGK